MKLSEEQQAARKERMLKVIAAITAVQAAGPTRGSTGQMPCPIKGCGGTFRWSCASTNGHLAGQCSAPGCVGFMQ